LVALVIAGLLAGGAPLVSAKGGAVDKGRDRPVAMGISVPLPPPS